MHVEPLCACSPKIGVSVFEFRREESVIKEKLFVQNLDLFAEFDVGEDLSRPFLHGFASGFADQRRNQTAEPTLERV